MGVGQNIRKIIYGDKRKKRVRLHDHLSLTHVLANSNEHVSGVRLGGELGLHDD